MITARLHNLAVSDNHALYPRFLMPELLLLVGALPQRSTTWDRPVVRPTAKRERLDCLLIG